MSTPATNVKPIDVLIDLIYTTPLTSAEYKLVVETLKEKHSLMKARAAARMSVGQRVKWRSKKYGTYVTGTVTKVGRSNVHVRDEGGMNWYCSASLLEPA